jgi:hypothetical protein
MVLALLNIFVVLVSIVFTVASKYLKGQGHANKNVLEVVQFDRLS